jgi:hypothetical protein
MMISFVKTTAAIRCPTQRAAALQHLAALHEREAKKYTREYEQLSELMTVAC